MLGASVACVKEVRLDVELVGEGGGWSLYQGELDKITCSNYC